LTRFVIRHGISSAKPVVNNLGTGFQSQNASYFGIDQMAVFSFTPEAL
jgi:hypothetical protein